MTILLVNHDKAQLKRWRESFREWHLPCQHTREGFTALQIAQLKVVSAVICRTDLPLISGFALSRKLKKDNPEIKIVLVAPDKQELTLPDEIRPIAWDLGPTRVTGSDLQRVVATLLLADGSLLRDEKKPPLFSGPPGFDGIIGLSPPLLEIFSLIHKVKDQDVTVLIQGESGTGKELVARAIHRHSRRENQPFVSVNCAAIPENLLESELFGHEKGAFTGAESRIIGRFEQADGGCIFMDEIGDMSQAIQAKVLRVFEGHPFERVGGRDKITVDVRILAATNRDLEQRVYEGLFREDLFYRLSAFPLQLPPLRDRMEDIPLITAHLLREHNRTSSRKITAVTLKATEKLLDYHWPGNIRHLDNVIKRAAILAEEEIIEADHVIPERRKTQRVEKEERRKQLIHQAEKDSASEPPEIRSLAEVEKEAIKVALNRTEMNISRAAKALGITRVTLYKKMKIYGLKKS